MDVYLNGELDNGVLRGHGHRLTAELTGGRPDRSAARRRVRVQRPHRRREDLRPGAHRLARSSADMNTPLGGAGPSDATPPTVSITSPASGAQVSDIVTINATAGDNVGVTGVQFYVDGVAGRGRRTRRPRTACSGTPAPPPTAPTRSRRGRATRPATRRTSRRRDRQRHQHEPSSGTRSSRPASTCRRAWSSCPTVGCCSSSSPGGCACSPPPYTPAEPDAVPADHEHRLRWRPAGHLRHRARPQLRDQPLLLRLLHARQPEPGPAVPLHGQRRGHRHRRGQRARALSGPAGRQRRAPRRGDHVRQRRQALLHHRRALRRRRRAGARQPSRQDPPHQLGRDRRRRTTRSSTAAGSNVDSIWAYGLRNPYRASYDAPTGRLFIGDVGGNDWSTAKEEVERRRGGRQLRMAEQRGRLLRRRAPARSTPTRTTDATPRSRAASSTAASQFPASLLRAATSSPTTPRTGSSASTFDANGNVTAVVNFEPADGSVDGPYGDIVYLTEGPDGAMYYLDLGYSDIGGDVRGQQAPADPLRRREPGAGRDRRGQPHDGAGAARRRVLERRLARPRGPAADVLVDVR